MALSTSRNGFLIIRFLRVFLLLAFSFPVLVAAQSLYKWVDEHGNVTYQDTPPPSNVNYEEQTYSDTNDETSLEGNEASDPAAPAPSIDDIVAQNPVAFYSIENCDACDLVRLFLDNNNVPHTEKDIQSNLTLQEELLSRAGQLQVPTVAVGDKIVVGYSKSALADALTSKGYNLADQAGDQSGSADGSTEDADPSNSALENLTNVFDEAESESDAADEILSTDNNSFDEQLPDDEPVVEIQTE